MVKPTIKELRSRYNLSQDELAKSIGISAARVCALEKDSTNIKISIAKRIADFFGVPITSIFFGKSSEITLSREKEGSVNTQ